MSAFRTSSTARGAMLCAALACAPELEGLEPLATFEQESTRVDPRLAPALERFAKAGTETGADDAARLDALLFEIGTLPELDPAALFAAWTSARGEARAALSLALLTCADATATSALIEAFASEATRPDHAYAHLIACVRLLAVETSLPSLRDLEAPGYRARVAEDLRRLHAAAQAGVSRARTAEFLDLAERVGSSAASDPAATRALLDQATLLCGRVDASRALELVRVARKSPAPEIRQALWIALTFACNRSFLAPDPTPAPRGVLEEELLASALERCEAFLLEGSTATPEQWIADGFAEAGFAFEAEGPQRIGALLEATAAPSPCVRFHAVRELAALAGMRPDLDLLYFPERARTHPGAVVSTAAAREKRLVEALRRWAENRHPELRR